VFFSLYKIWRQKLKSFVTAFAKNFNYRYVTIFSFAPSFFLLPTFALPTPGSGLVHKGMTLVERLQNIAYMVRVYVAIIPMAIGQFSQAKRELNVTIPDPHEAAYDSAAMIAPTLSGIDRVFAIPPNLHYCGAMIEANEGAEEFANSELKKWLDERDNVVFITFGSGARLSEEQAQVVVRQLQGFNVLWKTPVLYKFDDSAVDTSKLKLVKWVDSQIQTIKHPSVKLVISHGGENGMHESLYFGKMLLVIPFWADTFDNAAKVEEMQVGEKCLLTELNTLGAKLNNMLNNREKRQLYQSNATKWGKRLSRPNMGAVCAAQVIENVIELEEEGVSYAFSDPHGAAITAIRLVITAVVVLMLRSCVVCCCCRRGTKPKTE